MIGPEQRTALEALTFNPAATPDDVWLPSPFDVPELHERVVREILGGVNKARTDDTARPLGVAMQGRAGAGKTHLLGAVRETIQRDGGYFFLVNMINGRTFWASVALSLVEGMGRPDAAGWGTQLKTFLRRLSAYLGIPAEVRDAVAGLAPLTREHLDTFIRALRTYNREVGRDAQDTARALVLHGALDFAAQDVGYAHLISEPGDPAARAEWGLTPTIRTPQQIVQEISRLMALTLSPTVIAVDQLDTLFAQTSTALFDQHEALEDAHARAFGPVADGLLTLRDVTRRTLTVVSCLPDTWQLLTRSAPTPVTDRFRTALLPDRIPTAEIGRAIVEKRFTAAFADLRFVPPYPTWPIRPEAFEDAPDLTPRALLRRVDRHVAACRDAGEVVELARLVEGPPAAGTASTTGAAGSERVGVTSGPGLTPGAGAGTGDLDDLTDLDRRFAELVAAARVADALDPTTEDARMPELLAAGLAAWTAEQAPTGATYKHDPPPGRKPALHGRLIEVLDEATENEAHWCFRAIASGNAIAVLSRVRAACTMAGLDREIPQRRLVLLRNGPWPTGPRTRQVLAAFDAAGGVVHAVTEADLRVFAALRELAATPDARLPEWLVSRRPASGTALLRDVLGDPGVPARQPATTDANPTAGPPAAEGTTGGATQAGTVEPGGAAQAGTVERGGAAQVGTVEPGEGVLTLGHTVDGGAPFGVRLESLRRHTVVFAGSGSGKTVLIRRLVEECARQGVSSIVLDPNNDLARLGDPWPRPPAGWGPGDEGRARDYLDHTDVVVWTPRLLAGRPLAFQPLPDFTPVWDSPDEFDQAIRSAVEALAPRAGVNRPTRLAQQGRAVLTEALHAYARSGMVGLPGFVEFLADLPDGVSRMARADRLAAELAETLKAAMVTDPLFGGVGAPADPGVLLTPAPGRRARVSVISFVGLNSDEQRQSFVNQLQMALFAWIRRHPAGDRPLGGLFVMDEAQTLAPSTGNTPCTASSIALASQARKYGLGLVFATQAPKGLHNQISGNATTQFFGLLNAPAQIDAARTLAAAKGGRLPDIGLLDSGEFYAAGEGFSFVKVRTPLCLTHHPKAPLTPEEVLDRARPAG
ncbi:ATP-binding protein [Micromonospora siamensis]|uniref:AAA-like domain-containing protein n=1 Tax=Micromonospora siamensis TaxID=299152 RepID=A0A1C5HY92_9ACTN|nr:ATP-binding protein [Micromonospora siamensis]SCG50853.1 AAA-like domain-containing protein [Micromonospora siamensis]